MVWVAKRKVAVKTELCDQLAGQNGGMVGEKMKIEDSDNIVENMDTRFDGEKTSIWLKAIKNFSDGRSLFCLRLINY